MFPWRIIGLREYIGNRAIIPISFLRLFSLHALHCLLCLLATNEHDRKYRFFIHFHQTIFLFVYRCCLCVCVMFVHSESFVFVVKAKLTQNDEEVKKSNQSITLYAYIHNKRNANRKQAKKTVLLFWCLFKLLVCIYVRKWMENDSAIISFFCVCAFESVLKADKRRKISAIVILYYPCYRRFWILFLLLCVFYPGFRILFSFFFLIGRHLHATQNIQSFSLVKCKNCIIL